MTAQREVECRSCGVTIRAGEEAHVVLGGNVQCCRCYEGDEPCQLRWDVPCYRERRVK